MVSNNVWLRMKFNLSARNRDTSNHGVAPPRKLQISNRRIIQTGATHRKRGDQSKVTFQLDNQLVEFRIDTIKNCTWDLLTTPTENSVPSLLSSPDISTL